MNASKRTRKRKRKNQKRITSNLFLLVIILGIIQTIVLLTGRLDCLPNEQIEKAIMNEFKNSKTLKVPEGEIRIWITEVDELYNKIFEWQENSARFEDL